MDFDERNPGNSRRARSPEDREGSPESATSREDPRGAPIPDLVRKALELGFTGLFTTEQTIRRALGDSPAPGVGRFRNRSE